MSDYVLMSDYILVSMFLAVPFGLLLGCILSNLILAMDEQEEKYGTRSLILIIEGHNQKE
jgi:hypothetical protein